MGVEGAAAAETGENGVTTGAEEDSDWEWLAETAAGRGASTPAAGCLGSSAVGSCSSWAAGSTTAGGFGAEDADRAGRDVRLALLLVLLWQLLESRAASPPARPAPEPESEAERRRWRRGRRRRRRRSAWMHREVRRARGRPSSRCCSSPASPLPPLPASLSAPLPALLLLLSSPRCCVCSAAPARRRLRPCPAPRPRPGRPCRRRPSRSPPHAPAAARVQ